MGKFFDRAVKQSKDREATATKGPWSTLGEGTEIHAVDLVEFGGDPKHICSEVDIPENAEFMAEARVWEPKWREMAEISNTYIQNLISDCRDNQSLFSLEPLPFCIKDPKLVYKLFFEMEDKLKILQAGFEAIAKAGLES